MIKLEKEMYIKDIPTIELDVYIRMVQTIIDMAIRSNSIENTRDVQLKLNKFNRIKKILVDEIIERLETITDIQPS